MPVPNIEDTPVELGRTSDHARKKNRFNVLSTLADLTSKLPSVREP